MTQRYTPDEASGGYVECDECGHPIEDHLPRGCSVAIDGQACACTQRWTKAEIRKARVSNGLPAQWSTFGAPGRF